MVKAVIHQAPQANLLVANYLSEHLLLDDGTMIALFPPQLLQEIAARTMIETINLDGDYRHSFEQLGGRVLRAILNLLYQYSGASARLALKSDGNLYLTNVAGACDRILLETAPRGESKSEAVFLSESLDVEDFGIDH